jgi:hypothetical protein
MSTGEWITAVIGFVGLCGAIYWLFFGGDDE